MWSFNFFLTSIMLGVGLAMDAFSVSLANGLNEPCMKRPKMCGIAALFSFFQALMPIIPNNTQPYTSVNWFAKNPTVPLPKAHNIANNNFFFFIRALPSAKFLFIELFPKFSISYISHFFNP